MSITYRMITDPAEFADVASLEAHIWGAEAQELVAAHTLRVVLHTGGCLIGAYDDTQLIGFVVGFATHPPAMKDNHARLWSHIAAVDPAYQRQGIGYALKQEQRTWAQSAGYDVISWTFDPMLSQNANFNFNRLGAISTTYHVDFYGEMPNDLSRGLPSDRLEIDWFIHHAPTRDIPGTDADVRSLLVMADNGTPQMQKLSSLDETRYIIEIPGDFLAMKASNLQQAQTWQLALRETMQTALAAGYTVSGFRRTADQNGYILTKLT